LSSLLMEEEKGNFKKTSAQVTRRPAGGALSQRDWECRQLHWEKYTQKEPNTKVLEKHGGKRRDQDLRPGDSGLY